MNGLRVVWKILRGLKKLDLATAGKERKNKLEEYENLAN